MSAGSTSTVRTTLIRILADVASSIKELKDLATKLSDLTKAYMYLKHVLGTVVKSYDEIDATVRRTSDIYAKQNIVLTDSVNRYGRLSSGLKDAVSVFSQLIRTQGMTQESMVRLTVQARELSAVMNKSMEEVGKMMRELKVGLGLTNAELERMSSAMGVLAAKTGAGMDTLSDFALQGGSLAMAFGGSTKNALALAAAFENATSSAQGAQAMFGKFMRNIQSYGKEFSGLPSFFNKAAQEMLTSPVQAIATLQKGLEGLTAAERRYILASGQFTAVELQQLQELSKQGKVVNDSIEAQRRDALGIETIHDIYARVVGGVGEQMKRLWEDVKKIARSFGEYLVPVFAMLIAMFRAFLYILDAIPGPIKGLIGLVLGLATAYLAVSKIATIAIGTISTLSTAFIGQAGASGLASGGITVMGKAMWSALPAALSLLAAMLPYIAIAGAIALALGLVISAMGGMDNVMAKLSGAWKSFTKGFSIGFGDAAEQFTHLWDALVSLITPFERGKKGIDEMSQGMEDFGWWVGAVFKEVANWLHNTIFLIGYTIAWLQDMADMFTYYFGGDGMAAIMVKFSALVTNALGGALKSAQKLFGEFLEWIGLRDKADADKYQETDAYKAAKARADKAAKDYNDLHGVAAAQQQQAAKATTAANSAANTLVLAASAANIASQNTTAASQSAAAALQQAANDATQMPTGEQTAVVPNTQKPVVNFGKSIMPSPARQVAMASTVPVPNIPRAPQETTSGAEASTPSGSVPIQIILDDYVLGQAMVSINRKMNILGYGDAGGSLHGIR
jgi:phage-related minor tail protein